jgi:molecular chaperone Hsp33
MHYFHQSEQLPTWLRLQAGETDLSGLILQRLPIGGEITDEIEDGWHRLGLLADTLQPQELLSLPGPEVLRRLFHQEAFQIFEPQAVHIRCRCSHGRISEMLLGLGRDEVDGVLAEKGKLEVECGFCGCQYVYLESDVRALFAAQSASPPTTTQH